MNLKAIFLPTYEFETTFEFSTRALFFTIETRFENCDKITIIFIRLTVTSITDALCTK